MSVQSSLKALQQKFLSEGTVGPRLRAALEWLHSLLSCSRARQYVQPKASPTDAVIFTDASLTGLGVTYALPSGETHYLSAPVPAGVERHLASSDNKIFILELAAVLLAATWIRRYLDKPSPKCLVPGR